MNIGPGTSNTALAAILCTITPDTDAAHGGRVVYRLTPQQADALDEAATRIGEREDEEGEGWERDADGVRVILDGDDSTACTLNEFFAANEEAFSDEERLDIIGAVMAGQTYRAPAGACAAWSIAAEPEA